MSMPQRNTTEEFFEFYLSCTKAKAVPPTSTTTGVCWVSDPLSKVSTLLLHSHLTDVLLQVIRDAQFGAAPHRGTAVASLSVRTLMDMCMIRNLSCFVLFIDFSKAFDSAVRKVVMGLIESMKSNRTLFLACSRRTLKNHTLRWMYMRVSCPCHGPISCE